MAGPIKRIVSEPLLHFLVLALAIFAAYGAMGRWNAEKPDRIEVTPERIEQISLLFSKTWQRPPTDIELKGLIDSYVKEEIYYREGKKLGLDQDDEVIRRRVLLKMQLLSQSAADASSPSDAELQAYLTGNPKLFETEPSYAFEQIFFDPEKHGGKLDADIDASLGALNAPAPAEPMSLGDATLLPPSMALSGTNEISRNFGGEFAAGLEKLEPGAWTGPIKSTFGVHLVRILEKRPGHLPPLSEIRDIVLREWTDAKRKESDEQNFSELLKKYDVVVGPSQQ